MPEFTFAGTTPHTFPESRHSDGTPVRSVEPGEIRDLPRAINHLWRETTDEDRAAWAALLIARDGAGEEAAAEAETASEQGAGTAPSPALAKPRKDRTLSASDAGTPGGSEG